MSKFLVFVLSVVLMSGCASVKESFKGVLGVSTKALEEARPGALKKTFPCDYNACYGMVKAALKKSESYIYSEDKAKKMIALYVSNEDTTPVGIFFSEIDPQNTQVEVSSRSAYSKEVISQAVFSVLDKALGKKAPLPESKVPVVTIKEPELEIEAPEKGQSDAKEETKY